MIDFLIDSLTMTEGAFLIKYWKIAGFFLGLLLITLLLIYAYWSVKDGFSRWKKANRKAMAAAKREGRENEGNKKRA